MLLFKLPMLILVLLLAVNGSQAGWAAFFRGIYQLATRIFTKAGPASVAGSKQSISTAVSAALPGAANGIGRQVVVGGAKFVAGVGVIGGLDILSDHLRGNIDQQTALKAQEKEKENSMMVLKEKHKNDMELLQAQQSNDMIKKKEEHALELAKMDYNFKLKKYGLTTQMRLRLRFLQKALWKLWKSLLIPRRIRSRSQSSPQARGKPLLESEFCCWVSSQSLLLLLACWCAARRFAGVFVRQKINLMFRQVSRFL